MTKFYRNKTFDDFGNLTAWSGMINLTELDDLIALRNTATNAIVTTILTALIKVVYIKLKCDGYTQ